MLQIAWSIITTINEKTAQCTISQIASILGAEKQSSLMDRPIEGDHKTVSSCAGLALDQLQVLHVSMSIKTL